MRNGAPREERPGHDDMQEVSGGHFAQYVFHKLDPAWRLLPTQEQEAHKRELVETLERFTDRIDIRSYSLVGIRADCDLLLWSFADSVDRFNELGTALCSTRLGGYLRPAYSYLAITRRSVYVSRHVHEGQDGQRLRIQPTNRKYLFVYPFVKTRPWYRLTQAARQGMMDEHIAIGHKYPRVKLNTTYSYGLDDQEFMLAFETDYPQDFVDLVMELRHSEASAYTLRDTPIFTCINMGLREVLDSLGGARATAPLPAG